MAIKKAPVREGQLSRLRRAGREGCGQSGSARHQSCGPVCVTLAPGATKTIRLRFTNEVQSPGFAKQDFDTVFTHASRRRTSFMTVSRRADLSEDARRVQRQAFAGLLWNKQFYHYDVNRWLKGDPSGPSRRVNDYTAATRIGRISITPTSFRCRTNGSIPGTPPGTSRFTASRSRWSIRRSPRSSSS